MSNIGGAGGGAGRIDRAHQLEAETVHTPAADAAAHETNEVLNEVLATDEAAMGEAIAAKAGVSADDKKFEFYKPGATSGDEKGFTYQKPGEGAVAKGEPGGERAFFNAQPGGERASADLFAKAQPGGERASYNAYAKGEAGAFAGVRASAEGAVGKAGIAAHDISFAPGGERAAYNAYSKANSAFDGFKSQGAKASVEDTKLAWPSGRPGDGKAALPAFGRPGDAADVKMHKPITADAKLHKPFRPEEAVKQLEKAIESGDEETATKLADKLLSGDHGSEIMRQVNMLLGGGAR